MNLITKKLIDLSDEKHKEFNSKLCPDTNKEILGKKIMIGRAL